MIRGQVGNSWPTRLPHQAADALRRQRRQLPFPVGREIETSVLACLSLF